LFEQKQPPSPGRWLFLFASSCQTAPRKWGWIRVHSGV
jgi:hypothetical protein